ncbi:hypothetical protein BH09PLA1_BH09PLA1_36990 [soil metagenome]
MVAPNPPTISPRDASIAAPASRSNRRRRRWAVVVVVAIGLIVTAFFVLPSVVAPIVQQKLEVMVSNHLHARIEIGSLSYRFPYGVTVRDAKFISDESHGGLQLLSVKSLELALARIPLRGGPIIVKKFTVVDPVIHIVRREDGTMVGSQLARRAQESPRPRDRMKLSDVLQLREFTLSGATVRFEDRMHPDAKPMEWRNIGARLDLNPQSASRYTFRFAADSKPVARIELSGAADVDSLVLELDKLAVTADVRRDAPSSALPAQLQEILDRLGVQGVVRVEASGQVPLKDPKSGQFAVDVILDRVSAQPPDQPWAMDELSGKLRAERGAGEQADRINLSISDVIASGMGATLELPTALGTVDMVRKVWSVQGVSGHVRASSIAPDGKKQHVGRYVQNGRIEFEGGAGGSFAPEGKRIQRAEMLATLDHFSIQPPKFPQPIEALSGRVRLSTDRAMLQNFTALYGNDRLVLNQAIVSLADPSRNIELLNLLGSVEFGSPAPKYPAPLDQVVFQLQPSGRIDFQGVAALHRNGKQFQPDWALQLFPQGGGVMLLDRKVPVTNLRGEIAVAPRLIEMKFVEGDAFDGRVALNGTLVPRMPIKYQGEVRAQDTDLTLLSNSLGLLKPDGSPKLSGRAVGSVRFTGTLPKKGEGDPLQSLAARGRIYVKDGNFWSVPVLDNVVSEIKFARDVLTAGEAAAVFEVKDGQVEVHRAAINSTALGIQGSGTVGLDGALDLNLVVAPLGDWRRKIKSTGIPLLSNVAGDIVGGLQKLVNTATSQLLYQFRVTGRAQEPKIAAVPAPILTDNAASLFGMMMRGTRADRLIDAIAGNEPEAPKPADTKESNSGG